MTKRYIPHQEPPQSEEIMGDLAQILMITRTFSDFSEAMESVRGSADTEVKAIIEATLQLDDTIKTKIASTDMSVYVVPPGAIFDEERMVNEFGGDASGEEGERLIVAGTMEIGLLRKSGMSLRSKASRPGHQTRPCSNNLHFTSSAHNFSGPKPLKLFSNAY